MTARPLDLVGLAFGRLRVLKTAGKNAGGKTLFRCRCSCGRVTVVIGSDLKSGNTWSCGCGRADIARALARHKVGKHYRRRRK